MMDHLPMVVQLLLLLMPVQGLMKQTPQVEDGGDCLKQCHCYWTTHSVFCKDLPKSLQSQEFFSSLPNDVVSINITGAHFSDFMGPVLYSLPDLEVLRLHRANIKTLEATAFHQMPKLKELDLSRNWLRDFEVEDLEGLQVLDLSRNLLTSLEGSPFGDMAHLEVLKVSNNELTQVEVNTLDGLSSLRHLDLSFNQLTYMHPRAFHSADQLQSVHLQDNAFHSLHSEVFLNNSLLHEVELHNNPWECHCGLRWLLVALQNGAFTFKHNHSIVCVTPLELRGSPLISLEEEALHCEHPVIQDVYLPAQVVPYHTGAVLNCHAKGYPIPSVYWLTPRGVVSHPSSRHHMDPGLEALHHHRAYIGMPYHKESRVEILSNGSLLFTNMRHYFAGEYTCVAENPHGLSEMSVNVTLTCQISSTMRTSVWIAFSVAGITLIISIVLGLVRMCVEYYTGIQGQTFQVKKPTEVEKSEASEQGSNESSPCLERPDYYYDSSPGPSGQSTLKATTPIEEWDEEMGGMPYIRETLDEVRIRLRSGMERQVGRIRTRAQLVRDNSHRKIQTIRESSTQYMHTIRENIRESGSNLRSTSDRYGRKVRAGVVMGMEHVKYHVQSIKELCGPGAIGQTISISTISVSTDIDSQERSEVVTTKLVTYV